MHMIESYWMKWISSIGIPCDRKNFVIKRWFHRIDIRLDGLLSVKLPKERDWDVVSSWIN